MNASAFHDIFGTRDVFQVLQNCMSRRPVQFENLKTSRLTIYHEMHAQAIIRYFIYNIRNKIVKRREEKATVELLWTHNSVFASKLDNCGEEKNILKIVLSFTNKHKFYSN